MLLSCSRSSKTSCFSSSKSDLQIDPAPLAHGTGVGPLLLTKENQKLTEHFSSIYNHSNARFKPLEIHSHIIILPPPTTTWLWERCSSVFWYLETSSNTGSFRSLSCINYKLKECRLSDGVPLSRTLTIKPSATAMKPPTSEMNTIDFLLPVDAVRS